MTFPSCLNVPRDPRFLPACHSKFWCVRYLILKKIDGIRFRGSVIAKIVGENAHKLRYIDDKVTMYVYEEMIDGKKLTEIINTTHENVKYLPGHKLPPNVVST